MTTLRNSFEGGTNNAGIAVGNSGGASGDPLSFLSGSPVFSDTRAKSGTLSASMPGGNFSALGYNLGGPDVWVRFYLWMTNNSDDHTLVSINDAVSAGGNTLGAVDITSAEALTLRSGTSGSATLTGPMALNTWVRLEARWSRTTGAELRLYNAPDSGTPTGSVTLANNTVAAAASQRVEHSGVTLAVFYIDDFAVSTDGWIGPAVDLPPRPPMMSRPASQRASRH